MGATIQTLEAMERPPVSMGSRLEGGLLEVSLGPQHPSTHGVFRMNVALEGEIVRKLKPVFGYLHRNHEQIGEHTSYLGSMPYTHRLYLFLLFDDKQLGLCAQCGKTRWDRSSRARGIFTRDPRGADAIAKPRVAPWILAERHGRLGDAAHVCLP